MDLESLHLQVPQEVKEALRAAAADGWRSLSRTAVKALTEWCIERGYLTAPTKPRGRRT